VVGVGQGQASALTLPPRGMWRVGKRVGTYR
jgi:hypothetical protein